MKELLLLLKSFSEIFDRIASLFRKSPEERVSDIEKKNQVEKEEIKKSGRPKWD